MKKIIDGKMYNTATATKIAEWNNGYYTNDFKYCSEDLYITKKGNYFIHGEGGAMSEYSTQCGNSYGYGIAIIPISKDDAYSWLESHGFTKELEEYFSDRIEEA